MKPIYRCCLAALGLLLAGPACRVGGESAAAPPAPRPVAVARDCELRDGAVIRGPRAGRNLALVFTAHEYAEGGEAILDELARHRGRASFFLTGAFLANPAFSNLVGRIQREGHFVGPHSDQHLLYCAWENPPRTLVSRAAFRRDVLRNLDKIRAASPPAFFLPAYEHYNREIAGWTRELGLVLVNYTPGTRSAADYTGEADKNFVSSRTIFDSIVAKERQDPDGLNGFLLLLHLGAGPGRADKFSAHLGGLLDYLDAKGYALVRIDELLESKPKE